MPDPPVLLVLDLAGTRPRRLLSGGARVSGQRGTHDEPRGGRGPGGLFEHLSLRPAEPAGQRGDIVELGHHLDDDAARVADLDRDGAAGHAYVDERPSQGVLAHRALADAERAGVTEDAF